MRSLFFYLSFLGILSLLVGGCKSAERYTVDALPDEQLLFRYGGGFTGEFQSFLLLPNGQVFSRKEVVQRLPFREGKGIDPKEAKDFFKTFKAQKFGELGYNDPGNMTYTIQHIQPGDTSEVIWGGNDVKPTEELRTYWRRAINAFEEGQPSRQNPTR